MYPPESDFNAWLDTRLRDVSVPAGLVERLRRLAVASDEELDAALREVPVPAGLLARVDRATRPRVSMARLAEMSLAASLLVAIGLCYLGVVAASLWAIYPAVARREPSLNTIDLVGLLEPDAAPIEVVAAVAREPGELDLDAEAAASHARGLPQIALVEYERPGQPRPRSWIGPFYPGISEPAADPMLDTALGRWGGREVYGSHNAFDELPELKKVPGPVPRGLAPPMVRGFDLGVFIRYHVHPFVRPAANPLLRTSVVPLAVGTSSYGLTRRYLEDGELPSPDAVRTEEFLAALDYDFPEPKGRPLGLSVAAGPSVFRGRELRLMQIGVQARQMPIGRRPPARLTLAVDVSSSMRWGGRLEMVRRAIGKLVERLDDADRVALVAFSEDARVLIEDVKADEADQLMEAVATLAAHGSTNLGAGLRRAYAASRQTLVDRRNNHCVVLLTDGRAELDLGTAQRIEQRLADAAQAGIRLHVIDLGQDSDSGQLDPLLSSFAASGGGRIVRASGVNQVYWELLEILTGRRQLVGSDVELRVSFNPEVVLAYRLLGHEAAIAGEPADPRSDFRSGQSASAVYEVSLKPGSGGQVAVAELTWRDPASGKADRLVRRIGRDSFASSLVKAPLSLQMAAVAAETAEILRESPYVGSNPKPSSLARVSEAIQQLDTRLQERPTFREFALLVEQAERARSYRGGGRR